MSSESNGGAERDMTTRDELAVHDFTAMSGVDLLDYCGDDASKWAEAFCQIKQKQGWSANDIDEGLMIGWFANAIEHSSDVRRLDDENACDPLDDAISYANKALEALSREAPAPEGAVKDDLDAKIAALAHCFWSIHPSTIAAKNLTREQFYAQEMTKLIKAVRR